MDKFLEQYNLPKLNEEVESLNKSITADKIEAVMKKFLKHKSLRTGWFDRRILQSI